MTREFDDSRHCAIEQHPGLTWDRVNSEDQYQRTNYNYGNRVSGGISFDLGGAQISIGTGVRQGGYGGYGGQGDLYRDRYYSNNYGNDGFGGQVFYDNNTSREATRYYHEQQRYNQQRYQSNYQQDDYRYQQPRYNGEACRNSDDRYVIRIGGQDRDLYAGDQYFGPSNSNGSYQNDYQSERYTNYPSQNDRYLVDPRYSDRYSYQVDYYYGPQQAVDSRSRDYDDYSGYQLDRYQTNRYSQEQYGQDQYQQYRYPNKQYDQNDQYGWQDRYSQDRYQQYRYPNEQYSQSNRYGQQDRYGRNGYQNDYSEDWLRMRITLQAMLGHSAQEFNRNVPNDLGCATIVSAALRHAHGVRINDTNVNGLENSLRCNGYRALPVQYAQPGDCIIAHRAGGRPGHAAIYVGDGKVVNNSSQQGRVVVASLNNFASRDYQSVVAYRRA